MLAPAEVIATITKPSPHPNTPTGMRLHQGRPPGDEHITVRTNPYSVMATTL
jgi:hypothetical protein